MGTVAIRPVGMPAASTPGRFGAYGGRYVPETLMAALLELDAAYAEAQADVAFHAELDGLLKDYCGRRRCILPSDLPRRSAEQRST